MFNMLNKLNASTSQAHPVKSQPRPKRFSNDFDESGLSQLRLKHAKLIAYTKKMFSQTHQLISNQNQIFVLTDAEARVILLHSKPYQLEKVAKEINLTTGISLSEKSIGNNAIAKAIKSREHATAHEPEHVISPLSNYFCVASPVIGPEGQPLATIGIFAKHDAGSGSNLALASFMAQDLRSFMTDGPQHTLNHNNDIKLTGRQKEVLNLFSAGLSYKEIAKKLNLRSVKTVEEHLDSVKTKLACHNRRACIRKAIEFGFIGTATS